jgi:predicted Zn-dependent protease
MKSLNLFLVLSISIILLSCATSPLGRRQLSLMPESQMNAMGAQSFEELKSKTPIERDAKLNAYVNCVAKPITEAAKGQLKVDHWEIVVFKSDQINAFALPGGKIGVYTGILPVLKTGAQLAAVLGHEVGHVIAQHGNERVSQSMVAQGGLVIADFLSGKMDPSKKQILMAGLGVGMQYGVLLPYGRTQENEADIIGLKLMSQAGFDPHQAIEVWKNMSAASSGKAPPEFMSTHPSNESRIQNISSNLGETVPMYQAAQKAGKNPRCQL